MNRASVFEWHKRFKEGKVSVRDDERCGRSKEVRKPELIGQIKNFMDKDRRVSIERQVGYCKISLINEVTSSRLVSLFSKSFFLTHFHLFWILQVHLRLVS